MRKSPVSIRYDTVEKYNMQSGLIFGGVLYAYITTRPDHLLALGRHFKLQQHSNILDFPRIQHKLTRPDTQILPDPPGVSTGNKVPHGVEWRSACHSDGPFKLVWRPPRESGIICISAPDHRDGNRVTLGQEHSEESTNPTNEGNSSKSKKKRQKTPPR